MGAGALPPVRMRPSAAAAKYLSNDRGAWEESLAPEMTEPLDLLASRLYTGIVFVGPARSSKTFSLILGGVTYVVVCAPGDTLVTQMSKDAARDFSRMEVDRVIRYSPEILARQSPRVKDNNTFDKSFRAGFELKIGWPAVSQLSSKTLQYVFLTDYDRPENREDVDGEGPLWDLAQKRTETYMSRGKCVAESSPGEEMTGPECANWRPSTPHEAPPVRGILSLYNRGTRARRYWPCKHCGEFFEAKPGIQAFRLPKFEELEAMLKDGDPMTLAERYAKLYCPECGGEHEMTDRAEMKRRGIWVHEGQAVNRAGELTGERRRSNIASYWLGGVAATYQRWDSMLLKYFQGVATFTQTGDEQPLKAVTSMDLAAPYLSRLQARRRTPDQFKDRLEDWPRGTVPDGVRFLTACVDTQARSFRPNVFGWGVGLESWLIDRYELGVSKREDTGRPLAADPSSYVEDWELIVDEVLRKEYQVPGVPGLSLSPRVVLVDCGGREGVTTRAYEFWRKLRARGMGERIQLLRGDNRTSVPRAVKTWPDTKASQRQANARGDVPVWALNVNLLKDAVAGDLARTQPGPGYVHLPKWIDPEYFQQITAETKDSSGRWIAQKGRSNEDWDLHVYNRAACIVLNAEKINWQSPPEWAMPLEERAKAPTPGADRASRIAALAAGLNGN